MINNHRKMKSSQTHFGLAVAPFIFIVLGSAIADLRVSYCWQNETLQDEKIKEATSLAGLPLYRYEFSDEQRSELEKQLADAKTDFDADSNNVDNIIWYGRRLAYLWRYQDAIKVYSDGIKQHPNDPRLYRHRGHRLITVRKLDEAIADFEKAVELLKKFEIADAVEEDGQPNEAGIPTSSLYTNIYYHLGLAHYLRCDFGKAANNFQTCLEHSKNNDMKVATLDWLYMSLVQKGSAEKAKELLVDVDATWKVLENHAYHKRLLLYKGELKPEDLIDMSLKSDDPKMQLDLATYGYGIGMWYVSQGEHAKALDIFGKVTSGKYWSAFGFLAAERELLDAQED